MTETSRYILPFSKNISLSCSVCDGLDIVLADTPVASILLFPRAAIKQFIH